MGNATLIERLRSIDCMNVEECFLDSHMYAEAADRIAALEAEVKLLREAAKVLRDGYADAQGGMNYVLMTHGRLSGVGFDRVTDHYFKWVIMPEREGLLAGSHVLPALESEN